MSTQEQVIPVKRDYKSRMFKLIFDDKRKLLELYNALKDFLTKHRMEARAMSIYEYNEEEHMRMEREDAFEDGQKIGIEIGQKLGREEGRAEGQKLGQDRILKLIAGMTADGLTDQVSRLAAEPAFYEEMLKKYGL